MNIYAFYEKINGEIDNEYQKIIEIWKKSWSDNGWNPIILTLEDSKKHPDFDEFFNIIDKFPSIHEKKYNNYCYLRWLAIANIGGWYTDIDMINFGFKPQHYTDEIVTCSRIICPSTIYMNKENYQKYIIDTFKNYDFPDNHIYDKCTYEINDIKYTSDMLVLYNKKINEKIHIALDVQIDYDLNNKWENYSIIHFHGGCFESKQKKRSEIIKNYVH